MANKKYKLLEDNSIKAKGKTLYAIEAIKNFGDVRKGDVGGYIESEDNLSHDGKCWVSGDAMVFGNAVVSENALVEGSAMVYGNAEVYGNANLSLSATVYENAKVFGETEVWDAVIRGSAEVAVKYVRDRAEIGGSAKLSGNLVTVNGGKIAGKVTFNIKNSEQILLGKVDGFKPSKAIEIKNAAELVEALNAAGVNYEYIKGSSLPGDGLVRPGSPSKQISKKYNANAPKVGSNPVEEFKYWVKALIGQCDDAGAGKKLMVYSLNGNGLGFDTDSDPGDVYCNFQIGGNKVSTTFTAEVEEDTMRSYDLEPEDGYWNIGEHIDYDESREEYTYTFKTSVRFNNKSANPMKDAAMNFLVDGLERTVIASRSIAEDYLEKLQELE